MSFPRHIGLGGLMFKVAKATEMHLMDVHQIIINVIAIGGPMPHRGTVSSCQSLHAAGLVRRKLGGRQSRTCDTSSTS